MWPTYAALLRNEWNIYPGEPPLVDALYILGGILPDAS